MAMGSSSDTDTGTTNPIADAETAATEQEVTIEEQVLLDRDGIKITAMEYVEDDIFGAGIKVLLRIRPIRIWVLAAKR